MSLPIPLPPLPKNTMRTRVTQAFGIRNTHYKSGIHNGCDYAVPVGTPVRAPARGEITRVWRMHPSMGNACLYRFEYDGYIYTLRLLHLNALPVKGTYLAGQIIAYTGKTGDVMSSHGGDGAHLHLELWFGEYEPTALLSKSGVLRKLRDPQVYFLIK